MKQLTGVDNMFLDLEQPNAHAHVSMVCVYDQSGVKGGKLRFKQILDHIESRMASTPVFRCKLEHAPLKLDYPYVVEDDLFDIFFHVRHFALPKPNDWRQFCILCSRIHARPLDMARPLWQMYVIEGLDQIDWLPAGSFAIFTKMHHAIIDGSAATELTWRLHDTSRTSSKEIKSQTDQSEQFKSPGLLRMLTRAYINNITSPLRLFKPALSVLPKLGPSAIKSYLNAFTSKETSPPVTRFNDDVSSQRVFDAAFIDLDDIKKMKNFVKGATVNDAVLSVCGGALRYYLLEKGQLPERSLMALTPINTRTKSEKGQPSGNVVTFSRMSLQTQIEDPLERLKAVQRHSAKSKTTMKGIGAKEMTDLNKHIPAATMAMASRLVAAVGFDLGSWNPLHNCAVSNVPGPQVPMYMLGAELKCWTGLGPLSKGLGLFFIVSSYAGKLFISFTSCPEMVPDPAFMVKCLEKSFRDAMSALDAVEQQNKKSVSDKKRTSKQDRRSADKAKSTRKSPSAPKAKRPKLSDSL